MDDVVKCIVIIKSVGERSRCDAEAHHAFFCGLLVGNPFCNTFALRILLIIDAAGSVFCAHVKGI